ncbi:MAG: hypothetical protein CMN30_07490 [Sandaracinus sp.]|nr:hypothetical protein [Sandaracinus sp.]|tara:strand:+ start:446 stop:1054 length:609 start_codon:yes stop_codon:yes gene_type:complete
MAEYYDIRTAGSSMRVTSPTTAKWVVLAVGVVLAAMGTSYAIARLEGSPRLMGLAGSLAVLAGGLAFGFYRSAIVLDRDSKRITATWRWLMLSGSRSIDTAEKRFRVLRTKSRSNSETTTSYHVCLGEDRLLTNSEYQGDREEAERVAKAMAKHLGTRFDGTRDSASIARTSALDAKLAFIPLIAVLVALVIGGFILMMTGG